LFSHPAIERHPPLLDWVCTWTKLSKLKPLALEGWYEEGHVITGGTLDPHKVWIPMHGVKNELFLWAPQPPVVDAALEELLRRRTTSHVVLIPRSMTPRWRQLFNKACDFTFIVSPGATFWHADMFEPLWVGIVLPFTHHRPWCFKSRAPLLVEIGRDLQEVLATSEANAGNLLRKLLNLPQRVAFLSQHVACGVLHVPWTDASVPDGDDQGQVGKPMAPGRRKTEKDDARS
jgi:hypothetical protein